METVATIEEGELHLCPKCSSLTFFYDTERADVFKAECMNCDFVSMVQISTEE